MDIGAGVLAGALKIDFTRSFLDTTQCATFTELVAATDPHPYVIHTRIEATQDGKVAKMESVVTDAGDWVFGAAEHLAVTRSQDWGEIPEDKRDTRAVIQAAADAYLDNWGTRASGAARHALRPARRPHKHRHPESRGQYLRHGGVPGEAQRGHRRYVIDETIGAVSIFHNFPWLDAGLPKDPGTPASQMFRVEGGKNRYIHEATVCTTPGCGRARPGPAPAG
jgi:hypothetical protein